MTEDMARKTCTPCRGGIPPLTLEEASSYLPQTPGWDIAEEGHYCAASSNFRNSLDFIDRIGRLAEDEGHPAI